MSATAVISAVNRRRVQRALAWLEGRVPAEEVLQVRAHCAQSIHRMWDPAQPRQ